MLNKIGVLIIFAILLVMPISIANIDYNETGNFDNSFNTGNILFDEGATLTGVRGLVSGKYAPLVNDLNNDGIQEIVALDNDQFRFFKNSNLEVINSHTLTANERYSNFITHDIDGDGLIEVIIALEESELIEIVKLNGTSVSSTTINLASLIDHTDGQMLIKCFDVNKCAMAYSSDEASGINVRHGAVPFNSTSFGNETGGLITPDAGGSAFCFSNIRSAELVNVDGDENTEFVYSVFDAQLSDDESVHIVILQMNDSDGNWMDTPISQNVIDIDTPIGELTTDDCSENVGKFVSDAAVEDFDGSPNEKEIVIAYQEAFDDDMRMRLYEIDGDIKNTIPFALQANAQLISNIIVGDFFDELDELEFCVLGVTLDSTDPTQDAMELVLLCSGFGLDIGLVDNAQFNIVPEANITVTKLRWDSLTHAGNLVGSDAQDEIITALGIFDLDTSSSLCEGIIGVGNCALTANLQFTSSTTIVPVDLTKTNRNDILSLQSNTLQYFDDGFSNSEAEIANIFTDPCILGEEGAAGSTAKQNTTLEITITATDVDGDSVSTRVTIYEGTPDAQSSGFLANVSSGTPQLHTFILNVTGTESILIEARDSENQNIVTDTRTFSVGTNGVEFGDCTSDIGIVPEAEEIITNATLTADATQNGLILLLTPFINLSGLAGTTIFLIVMLVISFGIWEEAGRRKIPANAVLGMIAIANFLAIIIGARTGILSVGLVIIITIVVITIIGVFLSKFLTGQQTGS